MKAWHRLGLLVLALAAGCGKSGGDVNGSTGAPVGSAALCATCATDRDCQSGFCDPLPKRCNVSGRCHPADCTGGLSCDAFSGNCICPKVASGSATGSAETAATSAGPSSSSGSGSGSAATSTTGTGSGSTTASGTTSTATSSSGAGSTTGGACVNPGLACSASGDPCCLGSCVSGFCCRNNGAGCSGNGACCSNSCVSAGAQMVCACKGQGVACGAGIECCSGSCSASGSCT